MQYNHSSQYIRDVVFPFVCEGIGVPLTFDAAQVGSYAHRLRSYGTNLAPSAAMEAVNAKRASHVPWWGEPMVITRRTWA